MPGPKALRYSEDRLVVEALGYNKDDGIAADGGRDIIELSNRLLHGARVHLLKA